MKFLFATERWWYNHQWEEIFMPNSGLASFWTIRAWYKVHWYKNKWIRRRVPYSSWEGILGCYVRTSIQNSNPISWRASNGNGKLELVNNEAMNG